MAAFVLALVKAMSGAVANLRTYARYIRGLPGFLRSSITLDEAIEILRRRREDRERAFLQLAKCGIYDNPLSPYLALLKTTGCELGDLRNLVRQKGLEQALRALADNGVRVSFDEFKGRQPLIRNGREIPFEFEAVQNPHLAAVYYGRTGGSTGNAARVPTDIDSLIAEAPYTLLAYYAYDVLDAPAAAWLGTLPDHVGLNSLLHSIRCGKPHRWFAPLSGRESHAGLKHHLATSYTLGLARLMGIAIPAPRFVGPDQAHVIARWMEGQLREHGACVLRGPVSRLLRVSLAAQAAGVDLSGATFMGGGEPPTPAKVAGLLASGARYFPQYYTAEAEQVAMGCADPSSATDMHFLDDKLALITNPREVEGFNIQVNAFCLTTLLPSTHTILLNVEIDDYGIVEERRCNCPLHALGYTTHVSEIHSYRKLTGEGVTLVGGELIDVLQNELPRRFGGSPLDYQLMEEEDEDGFTRLNLIISPQIDLADEQEPVRVMLDALSRSSVMADLGQAHWRKSGSLRVKRMEPIASFRGKIMPLHLMKTTDPRDSQKKENN